MKKTNYIPLLITTLMVLNPGEIFAASKTSKVVTRNTSLCRESNCLKSKLDGLSAQELVQVFIKADSEGVNIWNDFNNAQISEVTSNEFLRSLIETNISAEKNALGNLQDQALNTLNTSKLIQLLILDDTSLNNKILEVMIAEKTAQTISLDQLDGIRSIVMNLNLSRRVKSGFSGFVANKRRVQQEAQEAEAKKQLEAELLLGKYIEITDLESAQKGMLQLNLILSKPSTSQVQTLDQLITHLEKGLFSLQEVEAAAHFKLTNTFIDLLKKIISEDQIKTSQSELAKLLLDLSNRNNKNTLVINENLLQTHGVLSFSEQLRLYIYTKLQLATTSSTTLQSLSRKRVRDILDFLKKSQNLLSYEITGYSIEDDTNGPTALEDEYEMDINTGYSISSNTPIGSRILCNEGIKCSYDLLGEKNLDLFTSFQITPRKVKTTIQYESAVIINSRLTYEGQIRERISRDLSLNAYANDVTIIDAYDTQMAPETPANAIEGNSGRAGLNGADSARIQLKLLNKTTPSKFAKIIIFVAAGDGGNGADGDAPSQGGKGGLAGKLLLPQIENNVFNVPVVQVLQEGSNGKNGNSRKQH